jgi:hypothetical protein
MNVLSLVAENAGLMDVLQRQIAKIQETYTVRQGHLKNLWFTVSIVVAAPFHVASLCGIFTAREFVVGLSILVLVELGIAAVYSHMANSLPVVDLWQGLEFLYGLVMNMQEGRIAFLNAILSEPQEMEWSEDLQDGITYEGFHVGSIVYVLDDNQTTPISHQTARNLFSDPSQPRTRNPFTNLPVRRITKYHLVQTRMASRTPSYASSFDELD